MFVNVLFIAILAWIVWRLCKNQETFKNIDLQLQYIFKKLDDLVKKHA